MSRRPLVELSAHNSVRTESFDCTYIPERKGGFIEYKINVSGFKFTKKIQQAQQFKLQELITILGGGGGGGLANKIDRGGIVGNFKKNP